MRNENGTYNCYNMPVHHQPKWLTVGHISVRTSSINVALLIVLWWVGVCVLVRVRMPHQPRLYNNLHLSVLRVRCASAVIVAVINDDDTVHIRYMFRMPNDAYALASSMQIGSIINFLFSTFKIILSAFLCCLCVNRGNCRYIWCGDLKFLRSREKKSTCLFNTHHAIFVMLSAKSSRNHQILVFNYIFHNFIVRIEWLIHFLGVWNSSHYNPIVDLFHICIFFYIKRDDSDDKQIRRGSFFPIFVPSTFLCVL